MSSPTDDEILRTVRDFVAQNFLYMRPGFTLADDENFLRSRVLDSMAIMELVIFLRGRYGIELPEADILEVNLGSLRAVTDYVHARVGTRGAA